MKYPEFEQFYQERLSRRPWDHAYNPVGFPAEAEGRSSDISAHMPLLQFLASRCYSVTEFGTRFCSSTAAFIRGGPTIVRSYDILPNDDIRYLQRLNNEGKLPCYYEFNLADTTQLDDILPTDLLFLDTLHTYDTVKAELRMADFVRRYLVFHDTSIYSQGEESVDRKGEKGILPAVREFLAENVDWEEVYRAEFNHGLLVLENKWS